MGADPCSVGELDAAVALAPVHDEMLLVRCLATGDASSVVGAVGSNGRGGYPALASYGKKGPQPTDPAVTN